MKLTRMTARRGGLAAAVFLPAALALSACGPVSPHDIVSPTPQGSQLATPHAAEPSAAAASASSVPAPASSSASASAAPAPAPAPTVAPKDGAVQTAKGLAWADGSPVQATTRALPAGNGSGSLLHSTVRELETDTSEELTPKAITKDGVALGADGKGLWVLGAKRETAAVSGYPEKGTTPDVPVADGAGFAWVDEATQGGKKVDRVLRAAGPGAKAQVLATLPSVKSEDGYGWSVVSAFTDGSGTRQLLVASPQRTGSAGAGTSEYDYYTVPSAGGQLTLVGKDLSAAWGTPKGFFAKRYASDGLEEFGALTEQGFRTIMRSTDPDVGGLPDSTDGTSAVLLYTSIPGDTADTGSVAMVLDLDSHEGTALDVRLQRGDENAWYADAANGELIVATQRTIYVATPRGVTPMAAVSKDVAPGVAMSVWREGELLGFTNLDITRGWSGVYRLAK